jgi:hypothetical protein
MREKPVRRKGRKTKEEKAKLEKRIVSAARVGKATKKEIATETGCHPRFVAKVLKDFDINVDELKIYKDRADDIWADKERLIMQHITPEKIKKGTVQQLVTAAAICRDKRSTGLGLPQAGFTSLVLNVDKVIMADRGHKSIEITPLDDGGRRAPSPARAALPERTPRGGRGTGGHPRTQAPENCVTPVSNTYKQKEEDKPLKD